MPIRIIAGSSNPVVSGRTKSSGDNQTCTVNIDGFTPVLKNVDPNAYVPIGFKLKTSQLTTNNNGTGHLSVVCTPELDESDGSKDQNVVRTTYTITMAEVQTELKNHPSISLAGRVEIASWLATEAARRYNSSGKPQYVASNGNDCTVNDGTALKFIAAYEAGIETYNRYFPIVRKISYCKACPGLKKTEGEDGSVSGGKVTFSIAGKFSPPDIELTGYDRTGWFKGGDEWQQSESRLWTHTEEWTWTPEGSGSEHAWIYAS